MLLLDKRCIEVEGKGEYENAIEDGKEVEWLNGVGLVDGHYCKHYCLKRDWSDNEHVDEGGLPLLQHYCGKGKSFGGWAYCCSSWCKGFEKGKSAGVKRIRNKIRKERNLGITEALRKRCFNISTQLDHFRTAGDMEMYQDTLERLRILIRYTSNRHERAAYQTILEEYEKKPGG